MGLDTARTGPKINYTRGCAGRDLNRSRQRQQTGNQQTFSNSGGQNNTVGKEVQFETVTYQPANQGNTQQIQQDISSVSCACTYGSTLSAYLPGQPLQYCHQPALLEDRSTTDQADRNSQRQ